MLGRQERDQGELFVAGSLANLVPEAYVLKRVHKVLDLSWLREEVKELYSADRGRPSLDPEAAVRLMLAGFFHGIVHDRKLMREATMHLGIRWFAGFRLHEDLPDHSTLTRIRQRWGVERFKRIFEKTVAQCIAAGLVSGETVHVDATLIRADVSWESLVAKHAEDVVAENDEGDDPPPRRGRPRTRAKPAKKVSTTDPEATLTTSKHSQRMEPSYKQHTAVDDKAGVVVDVAVTTGEASEGQALPEQIDRIEATTGLKVETVTGDAGYAHSANYQALEDRDIEAIIPPQKESTRKGRMPLSRFTYDAKHQRITCPNRKRLLPSGRSERGVWYKAQARDCAACHLRARCFSEKMTRRQILIVHGYEALLRARRRRLRWSDHDADRYRRHRWRVEGIHGEAKTQHGLRRAVRRGRANVAIQAYLTAAVMNLKRLAARLRLLIAWLRPHPAPLSAITSTQQSPNSTSPQQDATNSTFSKAA